MSAQKNDLSTVDDMTTTNSNQGSQPISIQEELKERRMLDERLWSATEKLHHSHGLDAWDLVKEWTGLPYSYLRFARVLKDDCPLEVFHETVLAVEGFAEAGVVGRLDNPILLADLADSHVDIESTGLDEDFIMATCRAFREVFGDVTFDFSYSTDEWEYDDDGEGYWETRCGSDIFDCEAASVAKGDFGVFQPRIIQLSETPCVVTIELWTDYGKTLLGSAANINLDEVELPADGKRIFTCDKLSPFIRMLFEQNKGAVK